MPRKAKTKPHPRSLDALFGPKPKPARKPRVNRCGMGHPQAAKWKTRDGCVRCEVERLNRERNAGADREREEKLAQLGPIPDVITMRVTSTGRLIVYRIPRHLKRRGKRRGRRGSRRL